MAKSIEVKMGADTKEFISGLKKLDKEINSTQKLATALDKSLDVEFDSSRAVEAQKQFQKALDTTEKKAQSIREQLQKLEASGRIDSIDYQTLQTELAKAEAQAVTLKSKLEEVKKVEIEQLSTKFKDAGEAIESAGQKLAVVSAAAAAAIAGIGAVGKSAATTGAEIDDLSQQFSVSAETIQRWQYLALQGGVDSDVFTKALVKMRAAMADMAAGTSNKATEFLSMLGIDANSFATTEEMFDGIVAALASVEDSTLQAAYANEIFGDKIATEMLQYINTGAEDLAKWNAEFDAMPSLTSDEAAQLALLDDSFNRLTTTMELATAQLGLAFAPIIERVVVLIEQYAVPAVEKLAEWFNGLSPAGQNAVVGILALIAALAPALILIGKISTGIGALIPLLARLKTVSASTALGVAALTGALALGINLIANWKNMSAIEKVLKSLAVAAMVAAAAVTALHASWSLGLAIGVITAGVVAGIAAIKAASEDIGVDASAEIDAVTGGNSGNNGLTEQDLADIGSYTSSATSGTAASGSTTVTNSEDNSTNNYYINIEANEYTSAEEVADIVSKRIATSAQSRR